MRGFKVASGWDNLRLIFWLQMRTWIKIRRFDVVVVKGKAQRRCTLVSMTERMISWMPHLCGGKDVFENTESLVMEVRDDETKVQSIVTKRHDRQFRRF